MPSMIFGYPLPDAAFEAACMLILLVAGHRIIVAGGPDVHPDVKAYADSGLRAVPGPFLAAGPWFLGASFGLAWAGRAFAIFCLATSVWYLWRTRWRATPSDAPPPRA